MFKYLSMVTLASFIAVSSVQASSTFRYKAYLPDTVDCATEIASISQRFEEQTGKKVTQQSCDVVTISYPQKITFHLAALSYQSEYTLNQNPTIIGGTPSLTSIEHSSESFGPYETYSSCVKDIPAQAKLFETNLKMKPVATYCVVNSLTAGFMLRMDSFNSSLTRFFVLKAFDDTASESEVNAIVQMVIKDGGRVAKVTKNLIYFYDESLSPLNWTPAHVAIKSTILSNSYDASQCKDQKEKVKMLLSQTELSTAVLSCTKGVFDSVSLEISGHINNWTFSTPYSGEGYASYEECKSNLDRVITEARASSSRNVGGVCGFIGAGEFNNFGVTMISRNPVN